ncbi:aldose 1-epimerase [Modicisalibacter coralii]|uniref:aldose 1-epimerase n=1 Tax=Modicisalibacter coralii TaxID=2304602 RepID=UPI00100BB72F|nr:aldose 1-epimerase [Halomonas coralii]
MTLTLENTLLRLEVAPEVGGSVVRFEALRRDGPVALFRPGDPESDDPNVMGLYPLVPWSNRISGGGFEWQGEHYPLAANRDGEPLPIHGDGWQGAWRVAHRASTQVTLERESAHQPPFDYRSRLIYRLDGGTLTVELVVTHRGETPAPYGLGVHPWFPRTPGATITAGADGVWDVDAAQLPTAWRGIDDAGQWDFRQGRALPDGAIDNLFTGWNGHARLHWPERDLSLFIDTDPPCPRYLVYSPGSEATFFCFEPVTHRVDAHHAEAPLEEGLVELAKGQTLRGRFRFQVMA